VSIQTFTSLQSAVAEWLARNGDPDLIGRFADFLALHEERMYYGADAVPEMQMPAFPRLRIREMEAVDTDFVLSATVAQPDGFLELIEASLNTPVSPLDIVTEGVIESYRNQVLGCPRLIAVSGTNFRVKDDPGGTATATIRYFQKLTTPQSGSDTNWIMSTTPSLYLNGCLMQAAIYIGDADSAKLYGGLYTAAVGALNRRRNTELAAATNVRLRLRGRTP
jgi:hypothetical protein